MENPCRPFKNIYKPDRLYTQLTLLTPESTGLRPRNCHPPIQVLPSATFALPMSSFHWLISLTTQWREHFVFVISVKGGRHITLLRMLKQYPAHALLAWAREYPHPQPSLSIYSLSWPWTIRGQRPCKLRIGSCVKIPNEYLRNSSLNTKLTHNF